MVTPEPVWRARRALLGGLAAGAGAALMPRAALAGRYDVDETPTRFDYVTEYNNYTEFGTSKTDPARHAGALTLEPWQVKIDGLVERPGTYDLDDLVRGMPIEDRIYRFRCVEAWSAVIPWRGFELRRLLDRVGVRPGARYVAFETLYRPEEMPGQRRRILPWPYREGLRLDEARHPLTLLATGMYGRDLPPQNGAPLRLVVPWKYGFKSIKAIVRISLTDRRPRTTWNQLAPDEYGFYANVNPEVDHPRWSQKRERRLGDGLFARKRRTLMFNGYAQEVAALYAGMDLRRNF